MASELIVLTYVCILLQIFNNAQRFFLAWFCTNFRVKHIQLLRPFGDDLKFSMFHHVGIH
jgi:hypothetical protein